VITPEAAGGEVVEGSGVGGLDVPGMVIVGEVGGGDAGEVRGNWIVPWPSAEEQTISPRLDSVHSPR